VHIAVFGATLLFLLSTWYLVHAWLNLVIEGWLSPWDVVPVRPPQEAWDRSLNDEFGFPAEEGIKYQGIHTFTALADLEALDTLQDNPNVVLVDLSANQIKDEIRARLGESIDITQVGIPNPSWYIVSGELKLP
jgi:hypothetical protein